MPTAKTTKTTDTAKTELTDAEKEAKLVEQKLKAKSVGQALADLRKKYPDEYSSFLADRDKENGVTRKARLSKTERDKATLAQLLQEYPDFAPGQATETSVAAY